MLTKWAPRVVVAQFLIGLLVGAIAATALVPRLDPVLGVHRDNDGSFISLRETADFVRRMDGLYDQLAQEPVTIINDDELIAWALEILPYMAYEGVTAAPVVPYGVSWFWAPNNRMFHVAGTASCGAFGAPGAFLNVRYANPVSAWYGDENLSTLVHELIHVQGGTFCSGSSADLEANTSIATVEVLAAMVNDGNALALPSLLDDLRGMGLSRLRFYLPTAEYAAFRAEILGTDPFVVAQFEKRTRAWAANPAGLQDVLWKYSVVPHDALLLGVTSECVCVERVKVQTVIAPMPPVYEDKPLVVDDLRYFLERAESFVG